MSLARITKLLLGELQIFLTWQILLRTVEMSKKKKKYSRTSRYGHVSNTDTSTLRTVSNVPTKFSYIFLKENLYNTDSL